MTKRQLKSEARNELARMIIQAGKNTEWILKGLKLVEQCYSGTKLDEIFLEIEEDRK